MGKRVDLSAKPYGLSAEQIRWVEDTLANMSDEEKVGQLFVNLFFLGADTFGGNRCVITYADGRADTNKHSLAEEHEHAYKEAAHD